MKKLKWSFTVALMLLYLGVFHLWMTLHAPWIAVSGLVVAGGLGASLWAFARRGYFVNVWDGVIHASVILDIVLEAIWIDRHEHVGFYLCAAAFAVVLVGYRGWWLRQQVTSTPQTA